MGHRLGKAEGEDASEMKTDNPILAPHKSDDINKGMMAFSSRFVWLPVLSPPTFPNPDPLWRPSQSLFVQKSGVVSYGE